MQIVIGGVACRGVWKVEKVGSKSNFGTGQKFVGGKKKSISDNAGDLIRAGLVLKPGEKCG